MSLSSKFVRAHHVDVGVQAAEAMMWTFKLLYEFWGFSINGGTDLTGSSGFATNGINMPAGFESGSSLLMSGTSGYTDAGTSYFNDDSADFTAISGTLPGKYLITWKSGSSSSDDGVYKLLRIASSSSLLVDTNNGATPYSGTLCPKFVTRTSVNYRIVDFLDVATTLTPASGNYMIFNVPGAPDVNTGQLTPQVKLAFASATSTIALSWSPSGSWNGTSFSDETPVISHTWSNAAGDQQGHISLWGASDYLICHWAGGWHSTSPSMFHLEVPQRLFSAAADPNPFVGMMVQGSINTGDSTTGYGGGWKMHFPTTNVVVGTVTRVKNVHGDYYPSRIYTGNELQGSYAGRYSPNFYNQLDNTFWTSDVLHAHDDASAFSMARVRARRWRVMPDIVQRYSRIGNSGEWLYVGNVVLLPWDNAVLPYDLFRSGD